MSDHTLQDLQQLQALPLSVKVRMTQTRIRQWVNEFGVEGVYVSFSGGKDSTVLLHLVRELYPNVPAVFCDTGLEFPEIRDFVKTFDNVTWLKPKMNFRKVIEKYGYPFISKEVSECVYGARRYLTSVIESESLDRQTDRQTDSRIAIITKEFVDSVSMQNRTRGGADRKYRKCRGIGEFQSNRAEQIWRAINQCRIGEGGSARDFANLTGIRVNKSRTIEPRLWKGYRQRENPTSFGNPSDQGESNDGEHP